MRTDVRNEDGSIDERFLTPSEDIINLETTSCPMVININNPHRENNDKIKQFNGTKLTNCNNCAL